MFAPSTGERMNPLSSSLGFIGSAQWGDRCTCALQVGLVYAVVIVTSSVGCFTARWRVIVIAMLAPIRPYWRRRVPATRFLRWICIKTQQHIITAKRTVNAFDLIASGANFNQTCSLVPKWDLIASALILVKPQSLSAHLASYFKTRLYFSRHLHKLVNFHNRHVSTV